MMHSFNSNLVDSMFWDSVGLPIDAIQAIKIAKDTGLVFTSSYDLLAIPEFPFSIYKKVKHYVEIDQDNASKPGPVYVSNTNAYRYYAFKFADNYGGNYIAIRRLTLQGNGTRLRTEGVLTSGLTSGRIPYTTNRGRLKDSSTFLFDGLDFTFPSTAKIKTSADSTTALRFTQADGTAWFNLDSSNKRVTIGSTYRANENGSLMVQVDGRGTGFVISNTPTEYTRFVSGETFKGMLGFGTVPFNFGNAGDIIFSTPDSNVEGLRISNSELKIVNDNKKIYFGNGSKSSIMYNGINMVINPKDVGSGNLVVQGTLNMTNNTIINTQLS